MTRDKNVNDLVAVMDDVYEYVKTYVDSKQKILELEKNLIVMLQQTTECGYFIREYAKEGFCESPNILHCIRHI